MNMDAIPILNDAVGGVTVTVVDDFSKVNPTITMGELTLRGDQVIDYVRTRKDVGDQKNVTRMERQKEYVNGFLKALVEKEQGDIEFLVRMYEQVAPYIVTDCSVTTLSNMLDRYAQFTLKEVVTPEGDNLIEDGHYAFYVDEEKLDELIVRLLYDPKP
jgi:anionic cell wall polymer biosynthesis LytR-Cps2A-Psr (LCP) family protein